MTSEWANSKICDKRKPNKDCKNVGEEESADIIFGIWKTSVCFSYENEIFVIIVRVSPRKTLKMVGFERNFNGHFFLFYIYHKRQQHARFGAFLLNFKKKNNKNILTVFYTKTKSVKMFKRIKKCVSITASSSSSMTVAATEKSISKDENRRLLDRLMHYKSKDADKLNEENESFIR